MGLLELWKLHNVIFINEPRFHMKFLSVRSKQRSCSNVHLTRPRPRSESNLILNLIDTLPTCWGFNSSRVISDFYEYFYDQASYWHHSNSPETDKNFKNFSKRIKNNEHWIVISRYLNIINGWKFNLLYDNLVFHYFIRIYLGRSN